MKTLFYILTLLMLLSKASFRGSDEGSYVSDLRCEYLTDPLAINDDNPLLGWKIVSDINRIFRTGSGTYLFEILNRQSEKALPDTQVITPEKASVKLALSKVSKATDPLMQNARHNAFGAEFIQLNGTIGRRISYSGQALDMLDWEKTFLAPFQTRSDSVRGVKPYIYIGLGKNLEGLVYWAAYMGTPEALALKKRIFDAIISSQDKDGYIGTFAPSIRGRHASHDIHEGTYIMKALAADHRIFGNEASGQAAERLAAWWIAHWTDQGTPTWGMENCFLEFGEGERDFRFADWILETHFPNQEYRSARWKGPLGYNTAWDDYDLSGRHVYHFTASAAAQLLLNQDHPHPLLTRPAAAAEDWIRDGGATLPGTFGYHEKWSKNQFGRSGIYNPGYEHFCSDRMHKHGETCSRIHIIELLRTLEETSKPLAWRYDVIERIIYNSFFASQSSEALPEWQGYKIRYDLAIEGPRVWYHRQTFCCPGNFRRFMFEIPSLIYRTAPEGLYVNLYEDSQAEIRWSGRTWKITQQTRYPRDGRILILPDPGKSVEASIHLRIPGWTKNPVIKVNGKRITAVTGEYASITRKWKKGDVIEINLPMEWQWIAGYREQQGRAGLLRGPLVFTLNPVLNNLDNYTDLDWEPGQWGEAIKNDPPGKYLAYEPSYQVLRSIVLDPSSITGPVHDASVYPDGIAAVVKGWKKSTGVGGPYDLELKLTEFPDEQGRASYFSLSDESFSVPDPCFARDLKENNSFPRLWDEVKNTANVDKLRSVRPEPPVGAILLPALRASYDEMTSEAEFAGRKAWMSVPDAERPYRKMGFRHPEDYAGRESERFKITVLYLDRGGCKVEVFYDSSDPDWNVLEQRPEIISESRRSRMPEGAFKPAGGFDVKNSGEWRIAGFTVDDARFATKSEGKDIMLYIHSNINLVIGGVYINNE